MEKLKRYLVILVGLACLLPRQMQAQKNLARTVVDARTHLPVDYVFIRSEDNSIKLLSNKDGKFIVIHDAKISSLTFHKMGYQPRTITMAELLSRDSVFLTAKQIELDEVVVSNYKIDTLVKDKHYYVEDYCVLPNMDFLIIVSKGKANEAEVCYYDRSGGIKQTKKIKNETEAKFVTDCFKNVHVLTNRFSRQVVFDSDSSFEFLPKYNRKTFDSALAACVLKIDTQLIMKQVLPPRVLALPHFTVNQNAPYLSYFRVSRHSRDLFYTAAYNARMREMIDHEIADFQMMGPIGYGQECNIMLFFNKIAGPLYAPVFLKNDTVVLFDFQENKILFLSKTGNVLKEVKIDQEQFATLHDFEMIYDEGAQKFYMKMRDAERGMIKPVNIYSGRAGTTIKLEKIFARNIQIVNDRIYYLVREKGWDDTQYLYQQN